MGLTTPRTWVPGELVSAALLNAQIRDEFNALFNYTGAWVAGTYNKGDIVVHDGVAYLCVKNGTTATPLEW